ncbi:hypothetical protein P9112_006326 [Eukaryota sp. TZLM1-RC]
MADIFQKNSDSTHSPNMQHQNTQQQHTSNKKKVDEKTDPDPTSSFRKEEVEREDEIPPSSDAKDVKRTDLAPSPIQKVRWKRQRERTRLPLLSQR